MTFKTLYYVFVIAIIDWIAVIFELQWLEYIAKPATIIALMLWMRQASPVQGYLRWFALGLLFSLAGDILLEVPQDLFIFGLVAFLIAHLAYITGFNPIRTPIKPSSGVILLIVALITWQIHALINEALIADGNLDLQIPVLIYAIVIGVMLFSALTTLLRPDWTSQAAWLVCGGAALFFLSDSMLAYNKFVSPITNGDTLVIISYHLGQIGLAAGAVLNIKATQTMD